VSENWVAYCRMYKYIHQLLTSLSPTDDVYQDPADIPFSRYNLKQKKAWLRARNVNGINGKSGKSEVDEAFRRLTLLPESMIPTIVRPIVSEATLENVNNLVMSWHACVARIMSITSNPCVDEVEDLDRHIKLFLTFVDTVDKSKRAKATRRDQKLPVWRRKCNYLGLLNYPDTVKEIGPLRTLSELDFKGEASIQLLKKHIHHGTNLKNWAYNTALAYYREKSFKNVLKDSVASLKSVPGNRDASTELMLAVAEAAAGNAKSKGGETAVDNGESTAEGYKNYIVYHDSELVNLLLNDDEGSVVSGIIVNESRFCVAVGKKSDGKFLEIVPTSFIKSLCGADYFTWQLETDKDGDEQRLDQMVVGSSAHYFLLLPLLDCSDGSKAFYLISSEWKEVVANGPDARPVIGIPKLHGVAYL
jgi:hypothetical protein